MSDCPYELVERFTDNGEHSHWELIDDYDQVMWSENEGED